MGSLLDEAARQAVGRVTVADAQAIATTAHALGQAHAAERRIPEAPARVLATCLRNPQGIGWSLDVRDLRPLEHAAMSGLVTRAYSAGVRLAR
jgi:hypothetical protein